MMKILVTGGAGYIGGITSKLLLNKGHEVVVFDNLERGSREVVDKRAGFFEGDIKNREDLERVFSDNNFEAIMHFAGLISVEESEKNPQIYIDNNVEGSKNLINEAIKRNVNNIIFSSTAAVYGNPEIIPIPEEHKKEPTSEYGRTKLQIEKYLSVSKQSNENLSFSCLRYFNACGALLDGSMGETHNPETHIIPLAISAALQNKEFKLYGTDYDTPDGSCIRDYIHVLDLAEAHILALEKIASVPGEYYYNVGTGNGISNRQILEKVREVTDKDFNIVEVERRKGDTGVLVADPSKINEELGFSPKYSDIDTIVESAWRWHSKS